ncbi:hypothetical protein ACFLU6_10375 [Acidobacteriota bacterium]
MRARILFFFSLVLWAVTCAGASELSNSGRDFWVALPASRSSSELDCPFGEIILSSDVQTDFQVTGQNVNVHGVVGPDSYQRILVPSEMELPMWAFSGWKSSLAIHVESNRNMNVQFYLYAFDNNFYFNWETYLALPSRCGGSEWYALTYSNSDVAILGMGEPTTVSIDPVYPCNNPPHSSVFLEPYEVYNWYCVMQEVTRTRIRSDGPVMVIAGGTPFIPEDPRWAASQVEAVMLPVCSWGVEHYSIPLLEDSSSALRFEPMDLVRIIAGENGAEVTVEDLTSTQVFNLGPGEFAEVFIEMAKITSTRPVMVAEFALSGTWKGMGGPMEMLIVPVDLFKERYRFVSPGVGIVPEEYVAVVVPAGLSSSLVLDGNPVSATFASYAGSQYEVAVLPVSSGEHVIECGEPFGAYILGYSPFPLPVLRGHAYGSPAGMKISEDCIAECMVVADAQSVDGCEGDNVTLNGSSSAAYQCTGTIEYQYREASTVLRPFDPDPSYNYQLTTSTILTLDVRCSTQVSCTDQIDIQVDVTPDDIPPDQGNILKAVKDEPTNSVILDFAGAPALEWRVYRDDVKTSLGTTPLTPDVTTTEFTDPGILADGNLYLYRIKGLSSCTKSPGP